jgi:putative sterol carrier protein/1,2-phenylacetyl-CoA epoxidase catalytic subunit
MSVAQMDGSRTGAQSAQISYTDLYRRWEESNWSAYALDFSEDKAGWQGLTDMQRRSALWTYSMFFYGEDRVTDTLSPYIDAAPTPEQQYFLATQQVDEARHAVFFHRFFSEVIEAGDGIASTLAYTAPQLGWGYRNVFARLDRMADELRSDRSLPKYAQAIALYHLVVEGALAQPGQHFIEDYFAKSGALPGFSEGMSNVSRDEQRHIGFGVKVLSELVAESDEIKAAIDEILLEVMPYTIAVFVPPNMDREYTRCYGFELEDIYAFAIRSVRTKWRAIGYPIEAMRPGVFPIDPTLEPEEIAARQTKLLEAGVTGPPVRDPDAGSEVQRLYFEMIANSADAEAVNGRPFSVQWSFEDADPWYVVIENGSTRAEPGKAPDPDLVWSARWADWVMMSKGALDPRRALLRRQIRFRGSPLKLRKFTRVFPRRRAAVVD